MFKNIRPPPLLKRQTTIEELLKKPIEVDSIFSMKMVETEEVKDEEGSH